MSTFKNDFVDCGVNVISRGDYNYDAVANGIATSLINLIDNDAKTRALINKAAMSTASMASWSNFINYYNDAYNVAIENAKNRNLN